MASAPARMSALLIRQDPLDHWRRHRSPILISTAGRAFASLRQPEPIHFPRELLGAVGQFGQEWRHAPSGKLRAVGGQTGVVWRRWVGIIKHYPGHVKPLTRHPGNSVRRGCS